jgi:hypothetical protein
MGNDEQAPFSGPESLSRWSEGLDDSLRREALVACAYCREGHAGHCVNDMIEEGHACPVNWLTDEIDRRKMESPDD